MIGKYRRASLIREGYAVCKDTPDGSEVWVLVKGVLNMNAPIDGVELALADGTRFRCSSAAEVMSRTPGEVRRAKGTKP